MTEIPVLTAAQIVVYPVEQHTLSEWTARLPETIREAFDTELRKQIGEIVPRFCCVPCANDYYLDAEQRAAVWNAAREHILRLENGNG